jgi:primosomal protein N' (replication factor Y)
MIASVILRDSVRSIDRLFDYAVPEDLIPRICEGQFVRVPFGAGNRTEAALVVAISDTSEFTQELKSVREIVDLIPVVRKDQIALMSLVRTRYSCTYGDVVRMMVPSAVTEKKHKTRLLAMITDEEKAISVLSEGDLGSLSQIRVLEMLLECKEAYVSEIMSALSVSKSPVNSLKEKGLIDTVMRASSADEYTCDPYLANDDLAESQHPILTDAQKTAVDQILLEKGQKEFLLHGVTGSGKTEVYLHCAQEVLNQGGSVLFLVPEISLTPQMIRWVSERFPEKLAVLHSRLTPKERYEQWDMIRRGDARIIVGARSAVFAPIADLGLILMDEEQDTSYKSETHPRYHARDVARMRARILGAKLVLGSATPNVETYYSAISGYSTLLSLPDRVYDSVLPEVQVIDMREELKSGNRSELSRPLRAAMKKAIEKGEQVILFLNKRGYSSMMLCRACGESIVCPHCSVAMTLHSPGGGRKPLLICHYCLRTMKVPAECSSCGSKLQGKLGLGTQQLEEIVSKEFPDSRIIRMDQDTTSGRGAHSRLLEDFRQKRADILLGTQMIAKGHDFPSVTVVGIISADLLIRASDFRAGERAFQLITQAAGRAGRGDLRGTVFIQTYQPEDDVILQAAAQDFQAFFKNEIEYRKRLEYPPFLALGSLILSHPDEKTGFSQAKEIKTFLDSCKAQVTSGNDIEVFGPGPAQIYRLRDRYRFRINIKAKNKSMLAMLYTILQNTYSGKDYCMYVDIDPLW